MPADPSIPRIPLGAALDRVQDSTEKRVGLLSILEADAIMTSITAAKHPLRPMDIELRAAVSWAINVRAQARILDDILAGKITMTGRPVACEDEPGAYHLRLEVGGPVISFEEAAERLCEAEAAKIRRGGSDLTPENIFE